MNYVISIFVPQLFQSLRNICSELELPFNTALHGEGTAMPSMLDMLGIESNERRIMLSVAGPEKTEKLIVLQKERLFLGVPGHGITVALPIKSIGGGKTVAYLNKDGNEKYTPELNYSYELIIAIANSGRTDTVMNAARKAAPAAARSYTAREQATKTPKSLPCFNSGGKGSNFNCIRRFPKIGNNAVYT